MYTTYDRIDELKWAIYNIDRRLRQIVFGRPEKEFLLAERAQYATELESYGVPVEHRKYELGFVELMIFCAIGFAALAVVVFIGAVILSIVTGDRCLLDQGSSLCLEQKGY